MCLHVRARASYLRDNNVSRNTSYSTLAVRAHSYRFPQQIYREYSDFAVITECNAYDMKRSSSGRRSVTVCVSFHVTSQEHCTRCQQFGTA